MTTQPYTHWQFKRKMKKKNWLLPFDSYSGISSHRNRVAYWTENVAAWYIRMNCRMRYDLWRMVRGHFFLSLDSNRLQWSSTHWKWAGKNSFGLVTLNFTMNLRWQLQSRHSHKKIHRTKTSCRCSFQYDIVIIHCTSCSSIGASLTNVKTNNAWVVEEIRIGLWFRATRGLAEEIELCSLQKPSN